MITERTEILTRRDLNTLPNRVSSAELIDVPQVIAEIQHLDHLAPPKKRQELNALRRTIAFATMADPVTVYVGSCPDYSHENGLYTHESLGCGLPLLSQLHLEHDRELLKVFERHNVPYRYLIMIADVEALDDIFAARFAEGNKHEFLARCQESLLVTQAAITSDLELAAFRGNLQSSSFFSEFGQI